MSKCESRTIRDVKVELDEDLQPPADPSPSCDTKLRKCDVCGGLCLTRNFGANACRACAAFFRRAVSGRRNYRCKALSSCRQDGFQDFRTFPACKCCRFRRCIKVGMQITGVAFSVPTPVTSTSNESTYLERHATYRSTLFLRRIRFLTEDGDCPRRFQNTTKALGDRITRAELKILREYFGCFADVWRFLRSDVTRDALTSHYFAAYALLEIVLTTSRNLGYRRSVIFTTVETCHSTMADDIAKDYNAWYFGSNIAPLPESEFFDGEASRATFVNGILNDLWFHYGQTSVDCSTSFDRLASILVHFNELWYKFCQVMVIIDLHVPKKPHFAKSAPLQACRNADLGTAVQGDMANIDPSQGYACREQWSAEHTADGIFSASVCARANKLAP